MHHEFATRRRPPLLPVKATLFAHLVRIVTINELSNLLSVSSEDPWQYFKPILIEDQAGSIYLVYEKTATHLVVAIKERLYISKDVLKCY